MGRYDANTRVEVHPFVRQPEGDTVVIGRPDTAVFVAVPPEAVEILDWLAAGHSVGESGALYQDRYGEDADLEDFLALLEAKGLVAPRDAAPLPEPAPVRYHLQWLPQRLAQRVFSPAVLIAGGVLIALALAAVVVSPAIVPGWGALYFPRHLALGSLAVFTLGLLAAMAHELAHLTAARAAGVSARFGFGHRLWQVVAETDLTGLWGIPKRQRYLPLLAGPLLDVVCAALLLLLAFAQAHGLIHLPPLVARLGQALLFLYFMQLLWQCYFFVRTDFYFVLAHLFGCRNLLADAAAFVRNQGARLWPRMGTVDQSEINPAEMRVVRWYALFWLVGRLVALTLLIGVDIPLLVRYLGAVAVAVRAGFHTNPGAFADALVTGMLYAIPLTLGLVMWLRTSLRKRWR